MTADFQLKLLTYPSPLDLRCEHNHHRGTLLPGHLPEVRAGVGQRTLASYVSVYETAGGNLHLHTQGLKYR